MAKVRSSNRLMERPQTGMLAGLSAGVLAAYLFDPVQGKRRRSRIVERMTHSRNVSQVMMGRVSRDMAHRTKGAVVNLAKRTGLKEPRALHDDRVITDRIRSKLGRYVSHPHAIHVKVANGNATIKGPILRHEVADLLDAVESVPGVRSIENRLETYAERNYIPSLQGGRPRVGEKPDFLQTNWAPATRFLAMLIGGSLVSVGLSRRSLFSYLTVPAGALLGLRGLTNQTVNQLTGIGKRKVFTFQKILPIHAPVDEVYSFWSCFEDFPAVIKNLEEVHLAKDGCTSRWTYRGPFGVPVRWETEITKMVPNEEIAWKSTPNSPIKHAGRIHFRELDEQNSRVEMVFSYSPPVGFFGHLLSKLLGRDPKSIFDQTFSEIKTFLEEGPSERQASELAQRRMSA